MPSDVQQVVYCPNCGKGHPFLLVPTDTAIMCSCLAVMLSIKQDRNGDITFKYIGPERHKKVHSVYVEEKHRADDKQLWWETPDED